jgi:hypothetical protein
MNRFAMTLTAAAASALVAGATVALPAIGDDSGPAPTKPAGDFPTFSACLSDHGLPGAPSAGEDLKPWLARKEAADPQGTKAAIEACQKEMPQQPAQRAGVDVRKLAACLRSHGLDAPSDPAAFKAWFARREADDRDALERVMPDCKARLAPSGADAKKPGVCGDDDAGQDAGRKPADEVAEPTT